MAVLDRFPLIIRLGLSSKTNLLKTTTYPWSGEITLEDTGHLMFALTTEGAFRVVQSLDMAVTYENEVVCNNGEIVYNF